MPAPGKHRRPKSVSLGRGIAAVTTGGAVLALPVLGATTASAAAPSVAEKAVTSVSVTAQANSVTKAAPAKHSVVSGESLSKIARDYSVSGGWKKLYEGNRKVIGENPHLIHPGITLTVGAKAAAPSDAKGKTGIPGERKAELMTHLLNIDPP
ncbi:LysM peptidoglycan-binding domain-containing protein, partial [Streptomyces rhizosphaericola]|uniref:LysM peptidoglycan-binding domain-containing protein n=1 Tax=Streptomyces rhizosphaericola TaxID=2564098 RepID=UPI001F0E9B08